MPSSSFIWYLFDIDETNESKVVCKICEKQISRGGKTGKTFTTSALHNHAKSVHSSEYEKAKNETAATSSTSDGTPAGPSQPKQRKLESMGRQMKVEEAFNTVKIWDINDSRSMKIHQKILRMIVLDNQPFSITEDQGFIDLVAHLQPNYLIPSRRYIADLVVPAYDDIKSKIASELNVASSISFTSDIWTDPFSSGTFISLTGKNSIKLFFISFF